METQAINSPDKPKVRSQAEKLDLASDQALEETLRYLLIEVEKNHKQKSRSLSK